MNVLVMAKEPRPGLVKTRLCPPLTHAQACDVATAALADTLVAVARSGATTRVLALDGAPGPWLPAGFTVVPQSGRTFAERLARAWSHCQGPTLQIGMDTPQVSGPDLDTALADLELSGAGGVLGRCPDGGWWALGMDRPRPQVFDGVPMSTSSTGAAQRRRMRQLGLDPRPLPEVVDVDTWTDAVTVAGLAPYGAFGRTVRGLADHLREAS